MSSQDATDLTPRIRPDDLIVSRELLGSGAFGTVHKAKLLRARVLTDTGHSEERIVAVKTLHDSYGQQYR